MKPEEMRANALREAVKRFGRKFVKHEIAQVGKARLRSNP